MPNVNTKDLEKIINEEENIWINDIHCEDFQNMDDTVMYSLKEILELGL